MGASSSSQTLGAAVASAAVAAAALLQIQRMRTRHQAHATDGRVFLHVTFEVKPANQKAFLGHFVPLLEASTKEPGCIKYQMTTEKEAPSNFVLIEEWADAEALKRHETLEHFTTHVPEMAKVAKITVHRYETCDVAALAKKA